MTTEAEADDNEFSSDEMDPETEALLYSRIHHQETFDSEALPLLDEKRHHSRLMEDIVSAKGNEEKSIQTDSGICSPKDSRSPSPLEESRLQRISTAKAVMPLVGVSNSSSDEDDDGIKIMYENVGKLKESHIAQKKNVSAYVYEWEGQVSSESSSEENDTSNLDIKLNITKEHKAKKDFQTFEKAAGKTSSFEALNSGTEYWPEHMNQFYNDVNHALKNKTLEDILEELPDDPQLWAVNIEDKSPFYSQLNERGRYFKKPLSRCTNCREKGHSTHQCPSPRKQIRCSMCGGHHRETRCDKSMCLRCGIPSRIYTRGCNNCLKLDKFRCSKCYCIGHEAKTCPDAWRRFHLTTHDGELKRVDNFVPPEEKWCPNCAKKGHYLHQCTAYLVSPYPVAIGHVVNYSLGDACQNEDVENKKLTRRQRFLRKKSLSIKRKLLSKSSKKDDINLNILNSLVSKAKKKEEGSKKRNFKRANKINGSKKRKRSGKNQLKIFN